MEMERLVLLVSALREENEAAHLLLRRHRLLLSSTKKIMEKRIPAHITKAKVKNTCDKAAIILMVAELDKLEQIYSPHMVLADDEDHVRGSLCEEAVLGPQGERGRNDGPLRAENDVRGPEEERVRNDDSLRDEADVPRPEEGRGRYDGLLCAEEDVLRLRQERGHINGSPYPAVDWDNLARVGMTRGGYGLSLPRSEALPVHACDPRPNNHPPNSNQTVAQRKQKLEEEWAAAIKTYNPMGERNKFSKIIDYDSPGVWKVPGGVYERSDANLTPISMVRMNFTVSDFLWGGAFFRILLTILLDY